MLRSTTHMGFRLFRKGMVYVPLLLVSVIMVVPLLLTVSISITPELEVFSWPPRLIPKTMQLDNYPEAVATIVNFPRAFFNSSTVSIAVTLTSVILSSMAGYAFARARFRGHHQLFMGMLATVMIPAQVLIIPLYVMFCRVPLVGGNDITGTGGHGLLNTYLGLILPRAVNVLYIFFFRQYFLGLPRELADAARMDGCSEFGVFWRIYLPLARPAIAAVGVLAFITSWNDLTWPLIMTSTTDMYTVQVSLLAYNSASGSGLREWSLLMAGNVLSCLPPFILFILFQRNIIRGMIFSGLKG